MKKEYECSFVNYVPERSKIIEARDEDRAAEKFAQHAHDNWDMWEVFDDMPWLIEVDGTVYTVESEVRPHFICDV